MSRRYDLGYGDDNGSFARKISSPIWHYGIVTNIEDPYNAGRIQVRIFGPTDDGLDDNIPKSLDKTNPKDGGIPWCEPLLPKFINVIPAVGEMVKVVTFDYRNKRVRRQYIGPVIGQQSPIDLQKSDYNYANLKVELSSYMANWADNAGALDGSWKIYPDKSDIALLGRVNTDVILRDSSFYNEITLRSGKIEQQSLDALQVPAFFSPYKLNKKNPSYISINFTKAQAFQNSTLPDVIKLNLQEDKSHVNLVADNINLISHKGSVKKGFTPVIIKGEDVTTQLRVENEKLHPLVYGDVLWEFLTVLRPYIESHIHKASRREPDGDITKNNLIKWFNDNMGKIVDKKGVDGNSYKDIEDCRFLSKGVKTN